MLDGIDFMIEFRYWHELNFHGLVTMMNEFFTNNLPVSF